MDKLIGFLGIDDLTHQHGKAVWSLLEDHAEGVIRDFYVELRQLDAGLIDATTAERLALKQKQHWKSLLTGEFDQQFFNQASLVGIKHREIGLDPKWYIIGYHKIKARLTERIFAAPLPAARKIDLAMALDAFVAIDMALALSSYSSWLID
jgi:hypothetical protein